VCFVWRMCRCNSKRVFFFGGVRTRRLTLRGWWQVHGKQTVQRSMRFKALPPLLLLNINRIDFCPERMEPVKLNNRCLPRTTHQPTKALLTTFQLPFRYLVRRNPPYVPADCLPYGRKGYSKSQSEKDPGLIKLVRLTY
jgi:hypothetical protein